MIYDCSNPSSFKSVEKWLDSISENTNSDEVIVILVCNKVDLVDQREI